MEGLHGVPFAHPLARMRETLDVIRLAFAGERYWATQVALATEWINYMLDPSVSRELTRRQGLANTLEEPPALSGDAPAGAIVWLEPVEDEARRAQLWQRILSGDRPNRF